MVQPSTLSPLALLSRVKAEEESGAPLVEPLLALGMHLSQIGELAESRKLLLDNLIAITEAERAFLVEFESESDRWSVIESRNLDGERVLHPEDKVIVPLLNPCREKGHGFFTFDLREEEIFPVLERDRQPRTHSILILPFPDPKKLLYLDHRFQSLILNREIFLEIAWVFTVFAASEAAHEWNAVHHELQSELKTTKKNLKTRSDGDQHKTSSTAGLIIGQHPEIVEVTELIEKVAPTVAPILINGESGTGKELVAQSIHNLSERTENPFVSENCAALAENLLEVELFGAVKGAFTGAHADRPGLFELASGGTLFLDEIGDTTPGLQKKLLRALQEKVVRRVGGSELIPVDVRIISATNKDLLSEVEKGNFREDLYYRLNVINITLPPLRERREDIPHLVDHFLDRLNGDSEEEKKASAKLMSELIAYDWPGNIRELQNEIQRLFALGSEYLSPEDLSPRIRERKDRPRSSNFEIGLDEVLSQGSLKAATECWEEQILKAALRRFAGNKARVGEALKIPKTTLYAKLRKFGLSD